MRLAYCYECQTLSKILGAPPESEFDSSKDWVVSNWIDRHMHGKRVDDHKGGQIFDISDTDIPEDMEEHLIGQVRHELLQREVEVREYSDEIREEAVACHRRHGQPEWPGKLCGDYRHDTKRVGFMKRGDRDPSQRHLCDFCPYQVSVDVEKKWRAGMYR